MELTFSQHRLLTQLGGHAGPVLLKDLKPAPRAADRAALVAAELAEAGKRGRSATLALTADGRRLLTEQPDPPAKPTPARPPKSPKVVPTFPFPAHRLFLLKLAFALDSGPVEGLSKILPKAERERLQTEGWLRIESTRPSLRCELTDAGWQWVEEHLGDEVGGSAAGDVLGAALARVGAFLAANDLRLADLLRAKSVRANEHDAADNALPRAEPPAEDLAGAIRAACRRLAHNAVSPHVLLADLRPALGAWDRRAVDAALLDLELAEQVRLVRMDDPREIRPEDRAAELRTPSGEPRHLLYWTGR